MCANGCTALQELDLDGDWDPDAHDRQMRELYEREAEAGAVDDDAKPTWDDDIDIADIVPPSENEDDDPKEASSSKKKKKKKKKGGENDADTAGVDIDDMDAEIERPPAEDGEWDGSEEMRKRALEKYMDELYELEFNDMVGLPHDLCYICSWADIGWRPSYTIQIRTRRSSKLWACPFRGPHGNGCRAEPVHGHQEVRALSEGGQG